jgi:Zn-dependent M28 family amino/carboxypeptidase
VAFNAEEEGLLGSRDFVASGLGPAPGPIRAVHVLEMVGYRGAAREQQAPLPGLGRRLGPPDFIGLLGNGRSNAMVNAAVTRAAPPLRIVGAKTWGPLHRLMPDLARSDHLPFWAAGIPAVLWTDTANFRNPHYHGASDTPGTLDYSFLAQVTGALREVVVPGNHPARTAG